MQSLSRHQLLEIQRRSQHLQVSRMPEGSQGYRYFVNGIEVDEGSFRLAISLIREPDPVPEARENPPIYPASKNSY